MSDNTLWASVLKEISGKLSKPSFETWLANTEADIADDTITVRAMNEFAADWVDRRYKTLISETVREVAGKSYEIEITYHEEGSGDRKVHLSDRDIIYRHNKEILIRLMKEEDFSVGQAAYWLGVSEAEIVKMKDEIDR